MVEAKYFSILLTWSAPESLNGILMHYNIQYSVNGTRPTHATTDLIFSISNLTPNMTVHNITVSATTGGGQGPLAHIKGIRTLHAPGEEGIR